MNRERRKSLSNLQETVQGIAATIEAGDDLDWAAIKSDIQDVGAQLDDLRSDEQDAYDNMPEGIRNGERGDNSQAAIDAMEGGVSQLEDAHNACDNDDPSEEVLGLLEEARENMNEAEGY